MRKKELEGEKKSKERKLIGFVGAGIYDIILYLSRILKHLDQKVLILDYADNEALACCIPVLGTGVIEYRGVDYLRFGSLPAAADYDYVLIDFGSIVEHIDLSKCDVVYMVSDLQLHHLHIFQKLLLSKKQDRYLILRDLYGSGKINLQVALSELPEEHGIMKERCYMLPVDMDDMANRIDCQYDDIFKFRSMSKEMSDLLYGILESDFPATQLLGAMRIARKGA